MSKKEKFYTILIILFTLCFCYYLVCIFFDNRVVDVIKHAIFGAINLIAARNLSRAI